MRSPAPENNHNSDQIGLLQLPWNTGRNTCFSEDTDWAYPTEWALAVGKLRNAGGSMMTGKGRAQRRIL